MGPSEVNIKAARWDHSAQVGSEMLGGVGSAGTGFEVALVNVGFLFVAKSNGGFNIPRGVLGGVGYVASIVAGEARGEILRVTNVVVDGCGFVPQDVDVTGSWHEGILCACAGI